MIDIDAMPFLADIPRVQASLRPAEMALWSEGRATSYIELDTRTNQVANGLLALGIKLVFLLLALFDDATMWMAVFADMGASLLVVGNGLRLLRDRSLREPAASA